MIKNKVRRKKSKSWESYRRWYKSEWLDQDLYEIYAPTDFFININWNLL